MESEFLLTWLLRDQLNGRFPQLDAYITVFSLVATWMMAHKMLENWTCTPNRPVTVKPSVVAVIWAQLTGSVGLAQAPSTMGPVRTLTGSPADTLAWQIAPTGIQFVARDVGVGVGPCCPKFCRQRP